MDPALPTLDVSIALLPSWENWILESGPVPLIVNADSVT